MLPRTVAFILLIGSSIQLMSQGLFYKLARSRADYEAVINHKFQYLSLDPPGPEAMLRIIPQMNEICDFSELRKFCFMAHEGSRLVGCIDILVLQKHRHYHLQNLIVNPLFRRQGVAKRLIHESKGYIADFLNYSMGSEILLDLNVDESNQAAKMLYMQCGFQVNPFSLEFLRKRQHLFLNIH